MDYEFNRWNKPDVNSFTYLHVFIDEIVEVVFKGNIAMLEYAEDIKRYKKGEKYDEYEMFMLVHKGFYNKIISEKDSYFVSNIDNLPLFNTVYPIWEKAKEMATEDRHRKSINFVRKLITSEEFEAKIPTPEWMKNIYKVAQFMGNMGIPPHPVFCHDQRESGKIYEEFRAEFVNK